MGRPSRAGRAEQWAARARQAHAEEEGRLGRAGTEKGEGRGSAAGPSGRPSQEGEGRREPGQFLGLG